MQDGAAGSEVLTHQVGSELRRSQARASRCCRCLYGFIFGRRGCNDFDVFGHKASGPIDQFVHHAGTLLQGFKPCHVHLAEMGEHILSDLRRLYKTKSLVVVKPFHNAKAMAFSPLFSK